MAASNKDDQGVEDAAILLMSLGEEEAAAVFKHLAPKEVQKLGETIARMKSITRERMDGVLDKFGVDAQSQHVLVQDTDEYVKAVLRKALGDDKANLLIDRILQGSDITGIESLKWMDASSVAELLRNEHPQIVAPNHSHAIDEADLCLAAGIGMLEGSLDPHETVLDCVDIGEVPLLAADHRGRGSPRLASADRLDVLDLDVLRLTVPGILPVGADGPNLPGHKARRGLPTAVLVPLKNQVEPCLG